MTMYCDTQLRCISVLTVLYTVIKDKPLYSHFALKGTHIYVTCLLWNRNTHSQMSHVTRKRVFGGMRQSKTQTGLLSYSTLHVQGLEMITFIIYNPWPETSFLLISDYLENPVLDVLSKFSTSQNTAIIYGSGAGSY